MQVGFFQWFSNGNVLLSFGTIVNLPYLHFDAVLDEGNQTLKPVQTNQANMNILISLMLLVPFNQLGYVSAIQGHLPAQPPRLTLRQYHWQDKTGCNDFIIIKHTFTIPNRINHTFHISLRKNIYPSRPHGIITTLGATFLDVFQPYQGRPGALGELGRYGSKRSKRRCESWAVELQPLMDFNVPMGALMRFLGGWVVGLGIYHLMLF